MSRIGQKTTSFLFVLIAINVSCSSISHLLPSGQSGSDYALKISTDEANKATITEKAVKILESKISAMGLKGSVVRIKDSSDEIEVSIFGDPLTEAEKTSLFTNYQLELKKVTRGKNLEKSYPTRAAAEAEIRDGLEVLDGSSGPDTAGQFFLVEKAQILTGEDIRDAKTLEMKNPDDPNQSEYEIMFNLKPEGAQKFGSWTGQNIGNYLAIVLNKKVQSAPVIKGQIFDSGVINGRFTRARADDIVLTLRSGYLPAAITIVDEKRFGN